jgi:SNF2 family DNA or RNA helicase
VLVICPESVMTTGWTQGLAKFAPELRTVEISGLPAKRKKTLQAVQDGEYDVAIIGYSLLRQYSRFEAFPGHALRRCIKCGGPRLTVGDIDPDTGKVIPTINPDTGKEIKEVSVASCQAHVKELNAIPWSVIIADEAHRALNPRSQTTQALWGVAKHAPSEPRRWAATGTIISRRVDQAWPVLHFLDPDAWPTKSRWVDWYCDSGYNYAGFWEVRGLKPERETEFQATFSAVTRRVLKEQVLTLPPKLRWGSLQERLRMSGEQLRVYEEMRKEMLAMVDEGAITAQNVLVQASRLAMLASGTGYPLPDGSLGLKLPSVKVDHLISMWKDGEWEGEQVALLFASRRALRMTEQALYEAKLITPTSVAIIAGDVPQNRRSLDINDFQAGKRDTVLLTYAAGGTGITLTAASTVIVFERNWSPILNAQGEDRFHRIGSERHNAIVYRDLVVENSNELVQLDRMEENAETLESLVHDKDRLRSIFGG